MNTNETTPNIKSSKELAEMLADKFENKPLKNPATFAQLELEIIKIQRDSWNAGFNTAQNIALKTADLIQGLFAKQ